MHEYSLDDLNDRFGIAGRLRFTRADSGPTLAEIDSPDGSARIALEGGQLLSWTPAGQAPVVWLSPQAVYKPGKSLRGGAPICWPWFGAHPDDAALPGHGFARNKPWQVLGSMLEDDGAIRLDLALIQDDGTRALWPHSAELSLSVTVGARLRMALTTRNTGDRPIAISEAIHTYFNVSDVANVLIGGLEGCSYIDKVDDSRRKIQQGPVTIAAEVDRVYLNTTAECIIGDPGPRRRIHIAKSGSRSTVVWNPWSEKGAAFGDMGNDGYRHMLCVETANALDDSVTIAAGASHTLVAEYWGRTTATI
jgi:glucose-6-phosphate 1-epimerase